VYYKERWYRSLILIPESLRRIRKRQSRTRRRRRMLRR
jgi:hypothetical protein